MSESTSLLSIILKQLSICLKPLGFKRKGHTLVRNQDDLIQFVNVQSSTTSRADRVKFTVNLAVYSESVNQLFDPGDDIGCRGWLDNHWETRLGYLSEVKGDFWWSACNEDEAVRCAAEIADLISGAGMAEFTRYSSTMALLTYIASGRGLKAERGQELILELGAS